MQDFVEHCYNTHPIVNYISYKPVLMEFYKDYFILSKRICTTSFHIKRNLCIAYKMHLHASYNRQKKTAVISLIIINDDVVCFLQIRTRVLRHS